LDFFISLSQQKYRPAERNFGSFHIPTIQQVVLLSDGSHSTNSAQDDVPAPSTFHATMNGVSFTWSNRSSIFRQVLKFAV
jgi:hypothetical protein